MKKALLLFYLLALQNQSYSQDWPIGTTWVYDQIDYGPDYPYNYQILMISGDTLIQNQSARLLLQFSWDATRDSMQIKYLRRSIIKTENEQVHLWNPDSSRFELIYDFNQKPGDTVNYYLGNYNYCTNDGDYVRYRIDSIQWVQTSGPQKKRFFYHKIDGNPCYRYDGDEMLEDMGGDFFFFQNYYAVDPPDGGGLVCFDNGSYHYPKYYVCKLPTGLRQPTDLSPVVYPNPTTGIFHIRDLDPGDYTLDLYNTLGQHDSIKPDGDQIDLGKFPSGVYILKLKNNIKSCSIKIFKI